MDAANNGIEEPSIPEKKKYKHRITMNVYCTEYEVVRKVAKKVLNYKIKEIEEDHDGGVHKGVGGGKLS
jgi:hypothetical protein